MRRPFFGHAMGEEGFFHGLKVSNLPDRGSLEIRVRFAGSRTGNLLSVLGLSAALAMALFAWLRGRWASRHRKRSSPHSEAASGASA
jgi:hypothetical protein